MIDADHVAEVAKGIRPCEIGRSTDPDGVTLTIVYPLVLSIRLTSWLDECGIEYERFSPDGWNEGAWVFVPHRD